MILVGDSKDDVGQMLESYNKLFLEEGDKQNKKHRLESYNELFNKEGVKQKRIMLLGEAGAGKTTFCQHLVDVWCNPSSKRQFDDVDIIQQYQFLFYVRCRSVDKNQTVLEMIKDQLFSSDDLRNIACNVLEHNADSCLILMDGFDELQRSAIATTDRHDDITGLPGFNGIQNCVLVVTSRPWKFFSIDKDERKKFSCLQLDGIKDIKQLVKTIFQEHQIENPAKSCTDFLDAIIQRNLSKLIKFPIMLLFAIDVWVEKGSLPKSVSLCYINMIELAISRSARKREEANIENSKTIVKKLLHKYSQSSKCLPKPFSIFAGLRQHAGLLLSLGHLAYDLLIQPNEQILVFQRNVCERYRLNDSDGSLKYCLDLGLLVKIESTIIGVKQKENFQFCHKTYQEFFAALWLSYRYTKEGSQEMSHIQSCIKSYTDLNNHSVLIQFLCGLCPEAGAELWKYVAQNDNIEIIYMNRIKVQIQVLRALKEAQDCCDHQGVQVYYGIRDVHIHKNTTDENVSLLCKMVQNNSCYLKHLRVVDICLSSSQYHSLLRSASSAIELELLELKNISCQSNDSSEDLPVLDLSKHCRLQELWLIKISISGLVLPSQEGSRLSILNLENLVLSHDNLVNICSSLSSRTGIEWLQLASMSCREHQDSCCPAVLDLHNHCRLFTLKLDEISMIGLVLPSQEGSQLLRLDLYNLVLSHDNLVGLCSVISSLSSIEVLLLTHVRCIEHDGSCDVPTLNLPKQESDNAQKEQIPDIDVLSLSGLDKLKLPTMPCSEQIAACRFTVLNLQKHRNLKVLKLDSSSISGILLPSHDRIKIYYLDLSNLVLSHDSLEQLPRSLPSLSRYVRPHLVNLSCSDHGGSCELPSLIHPDTQLKNMTYEFPLLYHPDTELQNTNF